ncbi:hypothetical protein T09_10318, partial [Trichinella sp. T9]
LSKEAAALPAMPETQVHSWKIRNNLCPFVCTPTSLDHFKKKNIVKRRLYIFKIFHKSWQYLKCPEER